MCDATLQCARAKQFNSLLDLHGLRRQARYSNLPFSRYYFTSEDLREFTVYFRIHMISKCIYQCMDAIQVMCSTESDVAS